MNYHYDWECEFDQPAPKFAGSIYTCDFGRRYVAKRLDQTDGFRFASTKVKQSIYKRGNHKRLIWNKI